MFFCISSSDLSPGFMQYFAYDTILHQIYLASQCVLYDGEK